MTDDAANPGAASPAPASLDIDAMVDAHADALFRFALMRVRDRHAAEDLVQETLTAGIEKRDSFRGDSAERTWLIGILRHKLLDHLRRRGRESPASGSGDASEEADSTVERLFNEQGMWQSHPGQFSIDPDDLIERDEFWGALQDCVDSLPPRQGQAFSLKVVDDTASEDVCKAMGVSSTNLWVLLHRARTRLRDCLEQRWFRSKEPSD